MVLWDQLEHSHAREEYYVREMQVVSTLSLKLYPKKY